MRALPASRPAGIVMAGWGDYGRLNRLAIDGARTVFRRHTGYKRLLITLVVAYLAQVTFVTVLDAVAGLLMIKLLVALPVLALLALAVRTGWRLVDSNRIVILAPDRTSVIDVVARHGGALTIGNHSKLVRSTSAVPLRASVADWLRDLPDHELQFRAQGRKVADVYKSQFPELVERSIPNVFGTIELTLARGDERRRRSDAVD